jgi:hypothetical protein
MASAWSRANWESIQTTTQLPHPKPGGNTEISCISPSNVLYFARKLFESLSSDLYKGCKMKFRVVWALALLVLVSNSLFASPGESRAQAKSREARKTFIETVFSKTVYYQGKGITTKTDKSTSEVTVIGKRIADTFEGHRRVTDTQYYISGKQTSVEPYAYQFLEVDTAHEDVKIERNKMRIFENGVEKGKGHYSIGSALPLLGGASSYRCHYSYKIDGKEGYKVDNGMDDFGSRGRKDGIIYKETSVIKYNDQSKGSDVWVGEYKEITEAEFKKLEAEHKLK